MAEQFLTLSEIAYQHNLSICGLSTYLNEHQISYRDLRKEKINKAVWALFLQHYTVNEIANELLISHAAVWKRLKERGIELPRGGDRALPGWRKRHWEKIEELNPEVF